MSSPSPGTSLVLTSESSNNSKASKRGKESAIICFLFVYFVFSRKLGTWWPGTAWSNQPENNVPFVTWNNRNVIPKFLVEWKAPLDSQSKISCLHYFPIATLCTTDVHQHSGSILSLVNFYETFRRTSAVKRNSQTKNLENCLLYLFPIRTQFLEFIHWMVFVFSKTKPTFCVTFPRFLHDNLISTISNETFSKLTDLKYL